MRRAEEKDDADKYLYRYFVLYIYRKCCIFIHHHSKIQFHQKPPNFNANQFSIYANFSENEGEVWYVWMLK